MECWILDTEVKQMLTITPTIRSVVDHDGAIILDISRNTLTTLNSTGAYVWQRLQRGMAIDDIVADLTRQAGVDEAVVATDLLAFLEDLNAKHLLTAS